MEEGNKKYQAKAYKIIQLDEDVNPIEIKVLRTGDILVGSDREQIFVFCPEDDYAIIGYTDTETKIFGLTELSRKNLIAASCFEMLCIYKYEIISGKYKFQCIQKFEEEKDDEKRKFNYEIKSSYELSNKVLLQASHGPDCTFKVYNFMGNEYQLTTKIVLELELEEETTYYTTQRVITTDYFIQMNDGNIVAMSSLRCKLLIFENNSYKLLNSFTDIKIMEGFIKICKINCYYFILTTKKGFAVFKYPELIKVHFMENGDYVNAISPFNDFLYVAVDYSGKFLIYEKDEDKYGQISFKYVNDLRFRFDYLSCLAVYNDSILIGGEKFMIGVIKIEDYDGSEEGKKEIFDKQKHEKKIADVMKVREQIEKMNIPINYAFKIPKKKKKDKVTYY
jgi:hypothetical protein